MLIETQISGTFVVAFCSYFMINIWFILDHSYDSFQIKFAMSYDRTNVAWDAPKGCYNPNETPFFTSIFTWSLKDSRDKCENDKKKIG